MPDTSGNWKRLQIAHNKLSNAFCLLTYLARFDKVSNIHFILGQAKLEELAKVFEMPP